MAKTYTRRSPEQVIADLEAKIAGVRQRAEAKQAAAAVKGSKDGVAFLAAIKAADRAIRVAKEYKNDAMVRALEAGRAPMAEHLVGMGLRVPDLKTRRGRKVKEVA